MKQLRMEQLVDGIFAIVMTLLVLELHVPTLLVGVTNTTLALELARNMTTFLSFIL